MRRPLLLLLGFVLLVLSGCWVPGGPPPACERHEPFNDFDATAPLIVLPTDGTTVDLTGCLGTASDIDAWRLRSPAGAIEVQCLAGPTVKYQYDYAGGQAQGENSCQLDGGALNVGGTDDGVSIVRAIPRPGQAPAPGTPYTLRVLWHDVSSDL